MAFHLICVHPFHGYEKGQTITDPSEVEKLTEDRERHFVRINAPDVPLPIVEDGVNADSNI